MGITSDSAGAPARTGRALGPAPTPHDHRAGPIAAMSRPRRAVLDWLAAQPNPVTVATVAAAFDQHENTVRLHLEALAAQGFAVRTKAPAQGRGRPALLYGPGPASTDTVRTRDYAGLASALAGHIASTSADPENDALAAGVRWGRELTVGHEATGSARAPRTPARARRRVLALLDELGFAPQPNRGATTARLTQCPLLDTARRYPSVVCKVHLGIVHGALESFDVSSEGTELEAFAEPGACVLRFGATDAAR